jgi:hypothetical protein
VKIYFLDPKKPIINQFVIIRWVSSLPILLISYATEFFTKIGIIN